MPAVGVGGPPIGVCVASNVGVGYIYGNGVGSGDCVAKPNPPFDGTGVLVGVCCTTSAGVDCDPPNSTDPKLSVQASTMITAMPNPIPNAMTVIGFDADSGGAAGATRNRAVSVGRAA